MPNNMSLRGGAEGTNEAISRPEFNSSIFSVRPVVAARGGDNVKWGEVGVMGAAIAVGQLFPMLFFGNVWGMSQMSKWIIKCF